MGPSPPKADANGAVDSWPRSRTQERKMNYAKKLKNISKQVMLEMSHPTNAKPQYPPVISNPTSGTETTDDARDQSDDLSPAHNRNESPRGPLEMFATSHVKPISSSEKANTGNDTPWLKERAIGKSSSRGNEQKKSVLNSILDRINCNVCSLGIHDVVDKDPYVSSKGHMIDKQFSFHADNDDLAAATNKTACESTDELTAATTKSASKSSAALNDKLDSCNTRHTGDLTISEMSLVTDSSLWTGGTGAQTDDISTLRELKELKHVEHAVEKLRIYSEKHGVPLKDLLHGYDEAEYEDDDSDLYSWYDKGLGKIPLVGSILALGALAAEVPDMVCRGEKGELGFPDVISTGEQDNISKDEKQDLLTGEKEAVSRGENDVASTGKKEAVSTGEKAVHNNVDGEGSVDSGFADKGDKYAVALAAGSVDRNNLRESPIASEICEDKDSGLSMKTPPSSPGKGIASIMSKLHLPQPRTPPRKSARPVTSAQSTYDVTDGESTGLGAELERGDESKNEIEVKLDTKGSF